MGDGAVVVGVDGSEAANLAVGWASTLARTLDRPLVLLHARQAERATPFPVVPRGDGQPVLPAPLREAIGDAADLEVHREVVTAPADRALVEATGDATLLVLGRSRRRLPAGPGSGSVTRRVLDRARCPVVIVPVT